MSKNQIRKCTWLKEICISLMVNIFKLFLDSLILNSRNSQWLIVTANLRLVSPCYQHFWFVVLSNLFHFNIDVYIHICIIVFSWRSEETQGIGLCLILVETGSLVVCCYIFQASWPASIWRFSYLFVPSCCRSSGNRDLCLALHRHWGSVFRSLELPHKYSLIYLSSFILRILMLIIA